MKKILTLLFFLLITKASFAQNLCDASCNLTISFPDGGSITAVESLTFTFGDGGLVDTGTITIPYANGSTLVRGVGEVLAFGAGGSFDIGAGGNIDYTNIAIETTGDITIAAVGGSATITVLDLSITTGSIFFNAATNIISSLTVTGDATIGGSGSVVSTGQFNIVSGTTILNSNLVTTSGTVSAGTGSLTVSGVGSLTLSGGQIIIDSSLSTIELNAVNTVIDVGTINLTPLTEITINGVIYKSDDGVLFKDPAGATGSLEFVDGAFAFIPDSILDTSPESGSSSASASLFLSIFLMTIISAFRSGLNRSN